MPRVYPEPHGAMTLNPKPSVPRNKSTVTLSKGRTNGYGPDSKREKIVPP